MTSPGDRELVVRGRSSHLEEQHAFTPPSWPKPHAFTGADVAALLEISEVDTGS